MSLVTQLSNLITRIGTEFKSVRSAQGNLASLSTTAKSSLVAAINELEAALGDAAGINDGAASTSTTYSSQKVVDLLAALKNEILGGASAAYDTLAEIQALMEADDTETSNILTALGNRVRFDAAQALTGPQQAQAIANIGAISAADVGDVATDFVTQFNAAIA